MPSNKWIAEDNKVVCKIIRSDGEEWTITFSKPLYDFLVGHVNNGDVHNWASQLYDRIVAGDLEYSHPTMHRIKQGKEVSQRAIGDVIRDYGVSQVFDAEGI